MNSQCHEIRSILIIDDDKEDYELVMEALQQINPYISVSYISKCEDAAAYRDQHFDLILLDINMPQSDGFHWLRAIREHGYADMPIVMYTNSMSPAHISKAYNEGATLYFSKPETYTNLIKGLRALIQMDWTNPLSVTQAYLQKSRYQTFQYE